MEEGSEHAYLMAHFHKARALGKLQGLESLRGSLASYQLLVQYFDANPKVRIRDRLGLGFGFGFGLGLELGRG